MKISEYFGIIKTQHELDFVDIDIDGDLPLFLDPYFISKTEFPLAYEAHLSLRSFFECLLCALRENRVSDAQKLFSHLGETNEICLGFSHAKPRGKGMGPSDAKLIFKSLKKSYALQTGVMEDIEDFRIFVENVDKDKVSDMSANIIKKQLIEYTQGQCKLWGIPTRKDTPSGYYWDRASKSWENKYTDMLVIEGRTILLVPKRIVSFSSQYTPRKYCSHFVLNFLRNEELRLNGSLVQHRKNRNRTPFVTKKSILEREGLTHHLDKNWLVKFTKSHPEVFVQFKDQIKNEMNPIDNTEIAFERVDEICEYLINHLKAIKPGKEEANQYHRTIFGILELLFYPFLCNPVIEQEIHEGRKRIDIVFDNCAEEGFFARLCNTHGIPCRFVMVECKNYSCDIANPELDQLSGRFSPNKGKFGIMACRLSDNINLLMKRCADTYNDSRGLIIPLTDEDICQLLKYRAKNDIKEIDSFIQERFHSIAFSR